MEFWCLFFAFEAVPSRTTNFCLRGRMTHPRGVWEEENLVSDGWGVRATANEWEFTLECEEWEFSEACKRRGFSEEREQWESPAEREKGVAWRGARERNVDPGTKAKLISLINHNEAPLWEERRKGRQERPWYTSEKEGTFSLWRVIKMCLGEGVEGRLRVQDGW